MSTCGQASLTDFRTAVLEGVAPDGGLYLPEPLTPLDRDAVEQLRGDGTEAIARTLGPCLFGRALGDDALSAMAVQVHSFPIPLIRVDERCYVLELFHGPTLAFKDVGARWMAALLRRLRAPDSEPLTVLTATSGDTGGAVAQAFHGERGVRVIVLFPAGRVSTVQERQFSTLGGNVLAVAVDGSFDDCQQLAQEAFADAALVQHRLTSANSINIGRLLPQAFYYASGWAQLPADTQRLLVATPSGNFGNLTAGLIAKRLGVPIDRFVAATNVNDVVPEYLRTGTFAPRLSVRTIANAMDVGKPSNFARMLALYDGDHTAMSRDVVGSAHTDEEIRACVATVYERYHRVIDPHTAVGWLGLETALADDPEATGIVLATAHPAKFADVVEPVIGTPVDVPDRLAACLAHEPVVERIPPTLPALVELLERSPGR
ncbi:MAG: threonine synthase [Gemmatimonadales bacterium]